MLYSENDSLTRKKKLLNWVNKLLRKPEDDLLNCGTELTYSFWYQTYRINSVHPLSTLDQSIGGQTYCITKHSQYWALRVWNEHLLAKWWLHWSLGLKLTWNVWKKVNLKRCGINFGSQKNVFFCLFIILGLFFFFSDWGTTLSSYYKCFPEHLKVFSLVVIYDMYSSPCWKKRRKMDWFPCASISTTSPRMNME